MARRGSRWRTLALVGSYTAIAVLGYVLGQSGRFPLHWIPASLPLTPLARIGLVLEAEQLQHDPEAWRTVSRDVTQIRSTLSADRLNTFDLLVAVRGLESSGASDWERAARACTALGWSRCDREALEALRERSRP